MIKKMFIIVVFFMPCISQAWTAKQIVPLHPGWNAVCIKVQSTIELSELPIKEILMRSPNATNDISIKGWQKSPGWLRWSNNQSIQLSGNCYLIQVRKQAFDWKIQGNIALPKIQWRRGMNLVGVNIDQNNPPTVAQYFSGDLATRDGPFYSLDTNGHWKKIDHPERWKLKNGVALLVYAKEWTDYQGPLEVVTLGHRLDYSPGVVEQSIRLINRTNARQTATLVTIPMKSGGVKLAIWEFKHQKAKWSPLEKKVQVALNPNSTVDLRLAVRRSEMLPQDNKSFLEIKSDYGVRITIPVTATTPINNRQFGAGLWIGNVNVTHVSAPNKTESPVTEPLQFRLIIHRNSQGKCHLLQQVFKLWHTKNKAYLLVTDEKQALELVKNGTAVFHRRFNSVVFGFRGAIPFSNETCGKIGVANVAEITMNYDDPRNPFVHKFHPDHNNLDERFEKKLKEGLESFTFVRKVILTFLKQDPDQFLSPEWGDTVWGGYFKEQISGVHQKTIQVKGSFRIRRVSKVNNLEDLK